jgi:hypothetical protein
VLVAIGVFPSARVFIYRVAIRGAISR